MDGHSIGMFYLAAESLFLLHFLLLDIFIPVTFPPPHLHLMPLLLVKHPLGIIFLKQIYESSLETGVSTMLTLWPTKV